jgi:hypothetical protein
MIIAFRLGNGAYPARKSNKKPRPARGRGFAIQTSSRSGIFSITLLVACLIKAWSGLRGWGLFWQQTHAALHSLPLKRATVHLTLLAGSTALRPSRSLREWRPLPEADVQKRVLLTQ